MVLINGWYFDFKNMVAFKQHNSYDRIQLHSVGTPPSLLGKYHFNSTWVNLFEEGVFNDKVDEEYKEFLLAEEIEKILSGAT